MKRLTSLLLATCLLVVAIVPAAAATCAAQHTVKTGDTLFRIGLAYGVAWPEIAAANSLANPNLIYPGQVLCIPGTGPTVTPSGTATKGPTPTKTATPKPTNTPAPTATRTATGVPTPTVPAVTIPLFSIQAVARDKSVTIAATGFPANRSFDVLMGAIGTQGVGGYPAGSLTSGPGVFTATLNIPVQLAGSTQIAVRLQNAQGYYSFGWFYNFTYP